MGVASGSFRLSVPKQCPNDRQRQALRSEYARVGVSEVMKSDGRAPQDPGAAILTDYAVTVFVARRDLFREPR